MSQAFAAAKQPPAEYASYVAAVRKADAIKDPLQRCLAYPDLPGNTWLPGVARARCKMFLTRTRYLLADIAELLARADGASALDAHFQSLLDAHFSDPDQREGISAAFSVFDARDSAAAERVARAWLAASPASPFAHAALGRVLEERGWEARGGELIKDTPQEKLDAMTKLFIAAIGEFGAAMKASPKLYPACVELMRIGRQSSDDLQAAATAQCLKADPASFSVIEEMMTAAEPRWGGSDAAMRAVAAYAQARVAENPVLVLFQSNNAFYKIERMKDGDDEAIAILEPAALQVPHAGFLRAVGSAHVARGDDWKGFVYLSQALRFSPDYAVELRLRAMALERLGEPAWARPDAERAVALHPELGSAHQVLGDIVRDLDGPAAAIPYYQRAMTDSYTRESAFPQYCGSLIEAGRLDEGASCVDELVAGYPENPQGWRQRLYLIGYDAPGSMEAMERFLAYQDPDNWPSHAALADTIRKVIAAKNGTASPADVFDARQARGRALERTASGRDYLMRARDGAMRLVEQAFTACRPAWKAGYAEEFKAVLDVQPDGKIAHVVAQPANDWSTCVAGRIDASSLPAPPASVWASGYPLYFELKKKR
jgi:tetratricopeptide (TPR) repeat protein